MGWCSGTEIFDAMATFVLEESTAEYDAKFNILYHLADALENQDWDCQGDSRYYKQPIVRDVFMKLHPDWFEDDDNIA